MKKLIVNDNCIGCGACVAIDSEHFDFDENGLSSVINENNLETDELKNAMNSCPVNAIKIIENSCNHDECHCADDCNCHEGCNCH